MDENGMKMMNDAFLKLIKKYQLKQIYRRIDEKTFVARYEFKARYTDLYVTEDHKYSVLKKYDPEPGGYGEEFVYIEAMFEPIEIEHDDTYSEEDLIDYVEKNSSMINITYKLK